LSGNCRLSHLLLFGFIYPGHRTRIPRWVIHELIGRILEARRNPGTMPNLCQGTLLSREQYLADVEMWGNVDARLMPGGNMTPNEIAQWTNAIGKP